jgi:hypothetical protein
MYSDNHKSVGEHAFVAEESSSEIFVCINLIKHQCDLKTNYSRDDSLIILS